MKLGDIPFDGAYMVYMEHKGKWNKVHSGCGHCPEEFEECYVIRLYPFDDCIIAEVSEPTDPRGMYVVESKDDRRTFEKHYTHKQNAIKAAAKVANDGYVTYYNPEMEPAHREYKIDHVRVYDMRCPDEDIDF